MSPAEIFRRVRATGRLWNAVLVVLDAAVIVVATVLAYYARFEGVVPAQFERWLIPFTTISVLVYGVLFALWGLYRLVLRYVGVDTLLRLSAAVAIGFTLLLVADLLVPVADGMRPVPLGVLFIQAVLIFLGCAAARMAARVLMYLRSIRPGAGRNVLIVGGGSAGSLLLREIQNRPDLGLQVVGFLDDERALSQRTINGVPVVGTTDELGAVCERLGVEEILVAMPSAPHETVRRILNAAADADVQTRIMPQLVIAKGSVSLRDLRSVDVEDLLGREPTPTDVAQIRSTIADKTVLVTGAAGSIGSELCRQIAALDPACLVLLDVDETRLYELFLELESRFPGRSAMCVCDIRDERRLAGVFAARTPQLVLHAAAYKHVPLMEIAPAEAVKTNVLGTRNLLEASAGAAVERFVLISTDKAVAPANVMGLTKSLAEREMLLASKTTGLNAVAVRFGNVLASRGSVVPIFEEQLRRGGPLTVTHPEVTRYFMTIPEAARLVLQAQAIGEPGDIFVLEMGEPVRIVDLAHKMIALSGVPADVAFVGLRPGEKLHEELITGSESLLPTSAEKVLRVDRVWVLDERFGERLESLIDAAERDDATALRKVMETLEPGFATREAQS